MGDPWSRARPCLVQIIIIYYVGCECGPQLHHHLSSLRCPLCCDNIYPPPLFSFHLEPQELELQLSSRPRAITNISILPSHKLLQIIVSRLQTPWTLLRYLLHNECICYATNRNVEKTRTVLGEDEDIYWSFKQRFAKTSPVERAFTFKPLLRHYDLWRRYAKSLVGTFNRSRGHLYDCEIFAKFRISNIYIMLDTYRYRLSPGGHWLADSVYFSNPKVLWLVMFPNIYSFCFIYPRLCFCLLTSSAVYWPEQWRYLPDVVMSRSQLNQYDIYNIYNIYNIHTSTQYPDDKLPAPALILLCPI